MTFRGGARRTFDLVIGADGIHSHTRGLAFGPEEPYHRYLGHSFAGFTMPNHLGLAHEGRTWNVPGRTAVLYAPRDGDRVHAFLSFLRPDPPLDAFRDPAAQRDLVAGTFAGYAWEIPRMVAALRDSDDLFFDVVSQIHMPRWSTGRVALVGDAAYAPSFFSGQGSSLALVGAYVLAGELAAGPDHADAYERYERTLRSFVEMNQALATEGSASLSPRTPEDLARRNEALRDPSPVLNSTGRRRALGAGPPRLRRRVRAGHADIGADQVSRWYRWPGWDPSRRSRWTAPGRRGRGSRSNTPSGRTRCRRSRCGRWC